MWFLGAKKWCSANVFSDTKQKHVCWKICKMRKVFGCASKFETFCKKIWNPKKSDDVQWNVWINIKKLSVQNNIFKRIPNMRFWIIFTLVQILFFWRTALGRFNQCFFFNFSPSASHGGQHFYSAISLLQSKFITWYS